MNRLLNKLSVLYVDDHRESTLHAKELLSIVFEKVFVAHDGCEAVDVIKRYHPDIIISDFRMPCLNGDDVIKFAREQVHKSICILITAYPDINNLLTSINDIKVDAYFIKPLNFNEIFLKLDSMLLSKTTSIKSSLNKYLSPQEQNIFLDIVKGLKPRDIAEKRELNVKTVSTYKYRILNKLALKNDIDLIHYAVKNNLL